MHIQLDMQRLLSRCRCAYRVGRPAVQRTWETRPD